MKKVPGILGLLPVLAFPVKAQTGPDTTLEIVAQACALLPAGLWETCPGE